MNFTDLANLAVAALDLAVVQSVIGAIHAADAAALAGGYSALSPQAAHPLEQRGDSFERQCCPDWCYPNGTIEKTRVVYRPVHRENCCPTPAPPPPTLHSRLRLALEAPEATPEVDASHERKAPAIQPPWATAPWQIPATAPSQVKVVQYRTDILTKGSLIDMFI